MPRLSAEAKATMTAIGVGRLPPSPHLPAAEQKVWQDVVASAGAGHLTERDRPLLDSFVTLTVTQRRIAKMLARIRDEDLAEAPEVKRIEAIGKTLASLSNRLKLGPLAQSKTPHQDGSRKTDNTAAPLLGGSARFKAVA